MQVSLIVHIKQLSAWIVIKIIEKDYFYVMEASVCALHLDQVVSPTTPRDGLMMKPEFRRQTRFTFCISSAAIRM